MNKILLVAFLYGVTNITFAAGIPKQFQGKWAEPQYCKPYSDAIIEVTGSSVNEYEEGCHLSKVIKSSGSIFSGIFKCSGEDEHSKKEVTLIKKEKNLVYQQGKQLSPPVLSPCNLH